MMYYKNLIGDDEKKLLQKKVSSFKNTLNYDISDSVSKFEQSNLSYNFDMSNGVLRDGIGINDVVFKYDEQMFRKTKKVNIPENYHVKGCWYFPYFDNDGFFDNPIMIIYCSNGKFYYLLMHKPDNDMVEIPGLYYEEVPLMAFEKINGIDSVIVVSKKDGMHTWNPVAGVNKIDNAPVITSMCMQYDRLFVTSGDDWRCVLYSESLNPTNFSTGERQGGVITLPNDGFGYCNKVISFKGNVYIFRDYNISKITAYGDDDEFVVSQLYVSNGKIHAGTICVCGDKIIYLATDGLYSFDGSKSTKLDLNISSLLTGNENDLAVAGYGNGNYYLACRMNFNDGVKEGCENLSYVNNGLLKYTIGSDEICLLRGFDIQGITVVNDRIDNYVLVEYFYDGSLRVGMLDMSGEFLGVPTHKYWRSAKVDFGYQNVNKILKEISFQSKTDGYIYVNADGDFHKFKFEGCEGIQKIKPLIKGKTFQIAVEINNSGCEFYKPSLKVGVLC